MLAAPQIARPQNVFRIALTRSMVGHVLFILAFIIAPLARNLFVRELPAGSPFFVDLVSATPGVPPPAESQVEEPKDDPNEIKVPPKPEIKKPEKKKEPDKKVEQAKAKPVTNTVAKAETKPKAPPKKKLTEAQIRQMLEAGVASVGTGGGSSGGKFGLGGTGTGPMTELDNYSADVTKVMYEAWDQPSELSDPGLSAVVKLRVERNGTITSRSMTSPSGNSVMDASVMRAVQDVSRLRALPPSYGGTYLDIPITFVLDTVL